MEAAEFASQIGIESKPALLWWVPFTLHKRDRIIAAVNLITKRVSHKCGVQITPTVQEAYDLDKANGNTLWSDDLNKDKENLKVAFDIMPDGKSLPVHYTKASGNFIFDVRMML